jgi:hypothetical protein
MIEPPLAYGFNLELVHEDSPKACFSMPAYLRRKYPALIEATRTLNPNDQIVREYDQAIAWKP